MPKRKIKDKLIFSGSYTWESLYDLERDVSEAVNPDFNKKMATTVLLGEFPGLIKVTISYVENA